ncbi:hypothetical protein B0H17DRAFT_1131761 [Mycena rosella]|uniref:Uncharacterized protein n=1 Tax=Mycena rosella TaxID=1033263 RepID=A0AAD7DLY1_MYCRO|nr:hypothetical protein B0H17DRAFT_1131761 [Mycena rosella]
MSPIPSLPTARAVDTASTIATSASFLPISVESASAIASSASSLAASVTSVSASPTSASSLPTPTPSINPWAWVPPLNIPSWTPLLILPFFVGMFIYVVYAAWKAPKPDAPNPNPSKAQTTRSFSERMVEVRARMGDADIARPAPVYPAAADNAAPGSDRFTAVTPLNNQRRSMQIKNASIPLSFGAGFETKSSISSLVLARRRQQSDVQDPRSNLQFRKNPSFALYDGSL